MLKSDEISDTNKDQKVTGETILETPENVIFDNLVWLNSAEAALYLRRSVDAIRIAVGRGQLKAHKWRRRLMFKKSDLERLMETSPTKGGH